MRIIDRGPFVDGRIIDLSHAAARDLDMIGPGVARVRIEVIRTPPVVSPRRFRGAGGRVPRPRQRRAPARQMAARYGSARLLQRAENPGVWRVLVGAETTEDAATAWPNASAQESGEKIPASSYD